MFRVQESRPVEVKARLNVDRFIKLWIRNWSPGETLERRRAFGRRVYNRVPVCAVFSI